MTADFFYRHKAGLLLFFYSALSLICVANRVDPYVQGIKAGAWFLFRPAVVHSGNFFGKIDIFHVRFFRLFRAEGENHLLRNQLSDLALREIERDALAEENHRLRGLLGLREKEFAQAVTAFVVGNDLRDWFYAIVLDKGEKDGIQSTAAVIGGAPEKPALVGRIVEVDASTSKVLLITDPVSAVSVTIGEQGELGLLEGRSRPTVAVRYLSNRAVVQVGDEVRTAGLSGIFPAGIPVGRVTQVFVTPDGFFKEAIVSPYLNLSALREVLVLKQAVVIGLEPNQ